MGAPLSGRRSGKEFGDERVFVIGPCTARQGSVQFGSESLLWIGEKAEALSELQLFATRSRLWGLTWMVVFVAYACLYFFVL